MIVLKMKKTDDVMKIRMKSNLSIPIFARMDIRSQAWAADRHWCREPTPDSV